MQMEASSWKNKKVGWFANSALPCGFCFGFAAGLGFAGFGDLRSRWGVGQWLQQLWGSMRSGEQRISEPDAAAMDWECHPGTTLGQPSALLNLSSSMFPSVFLYFCFYLQCTLYCIMYFCISIFWKMSPKTKWPTFRLPLFLNRPNEWKLIFLNVILVIYVLFLPFLLLCTMCLFHRVLTYDVWFAADRESSEEKKHMDWNCVFSQNCY